MQKWKLPIIFGTIVATSISGANPALAGLVPTPISVVASIVGYRACIRAAGIDGTVTLEEEDACTLIAFDPTSADVTNIELAFSFDPEKLEVIPTPLFFGDFSETGAFLPITEPTISVELPLEPVPDFDIELALSPRVNTTHNLVVDNINGNVNFSMDLTSNPIPQDAVPQNFFGIQVVSKGGSFASVEYFDTPGDYDLTQTSFTCTLLDPPQGEPTGCGSENPVIGVNFTTTPEPSSIMGLFSLGILGLGATLKRTLKRSDSVEKELTKIG